MTLYLKEQRDALSLCLSDAEDYHGTLESMGDFLEREVATLAKSVDQEETFPRESLEKLRRQGLFGLAFPKEKGGKGFPFPVYAVAVEMTARACANTALQLSLQGMVCDGIGRYGDAAQQETFLREKGLMEGRSLGAFALTEPCCGSDAKSIRTKAVPSEGSYVLDGSKTMISNPGQADYLLLFARTGKGVSCFIVPRETPGLVVSGDMRKLGLRGSRLSALRIAGCAVPKENLLGEEGEGLEYAKQILNSGRITIGAIAVGIAQAAWGKALRHASKREAFGGSISRFQLVQGKLADMAVGIRAARLLVLSAAAAKESGGDFAREAAEAKLFSTETALRVCDAAIQIHGGYGYLDAYDVHRHWRDARGLTIGEGTSDMLRLLIAHLALKGA